MPKSQHTISLRSPEDTSNFARRVAEHVKVGDVFLLEGGIGAGKTHFARSLIQALLEYPEDVPSPTFTLVQTYETPKFEIWHTDLYRLTSPDEIVELGLLEAFEDAVCLVEWPDRLAELTPQNAVTFQFSLGEDLEERKLSVITPNPKWSKLMDKVLHDQS